MARKRQVNTMQTSNPSQSDMGNAHRQVEQEIENLDMFWSEIIDDEQSFDHMLENPIGRLLKLISCLPEIRHEKVLHARRQIQQQDTELDNQLDVALDRVLEELISEGSF